MPQQQPSSADFNLNKDTQLCMSLASRPGNFGTRFHNYLYRNLGLNFVYKAFTTQDLYHAIQGIRALGIRGCAISMPFKEESLKYLDAVDSTASRIGSVNTIVNDQGHLTGYNTDYIAIRELLRANEVSPQLSVAVFGSGGMAKAAVSVLNELGFKDCTVFSRNPKSGSELADTYHYRWKKDFDDRSYDLLVNVTPVGMMPDIHGVPFPAGMIEKSQVILDAVANPPESQLIQLGKSFGKKVISGHEITVIQAREQFRLYTGVNPPHDLVRQAGELARS